MMTPQRAQARNALLLLGLAQALAALSASMPADAGSCRPRAPPLQTGGAQNGPRGAVCGARHAQAPEAIAPSARLRGGFLATPATLDAGPQISARVSTATKLKQRRPFWVTGEEPEREAGAPQGDFVLLQGFDWKLLSDRRTLYTRLAAEMPALAEAGVTSVWFPPPSESADPQGYLPGRWYVLSNRTLLEAAVSAAREAGIVPMVDVVLNHRTAMRISENSSGWTDFEGPDWGEWAIVADDWKCHPEEHLKTCPDNCTCGALDTGENACYAPDIDHTNPTVQADIIEWLRWLRTDIGFEAFRFDNTKGYAGNYTNYYIQQTDPLFAVSEFYDSNRNLVSGWLDSSSKASAVFDFGLRYKLRESVKHDDFSLMMDEWMGPMLWYDQDSAVTFTDNHDTAGDHHFEITDVFGTTNQIAVGYAMILSHPSRPCVFWQDWMGPNRNVIRTLLKIRENANIGPASTWRVVEGRRGLYAAYVGDKIAMKMGSDPWDPNEGLSVPAWRVGASGGVGDAKGLGPVDPRIVPPGHKLLLDASFDAEGHDRNMIKARVTAFCPASADGRGPTTVTVRAFAADSTWPWPATNETSTFMLRQGLIMHWAAGTGSSAEWGRPSDNMLPPPLGPNSEGFESWREGDAVQTRFKTATSLAEETTGFEALQPHVLEVTLEIPASVRAIQFVLKHLAIAHDEEDKWYKADGDFHRPQGDFHIRLPKKNDGAPFWSVWERMEEEKVFQQV